MKGLDALSGRTDRGPVGPLRRVDPWATTLRLTAAYGLVRYGLAGGANAFVVAAMCLAGLLFPPLLRRGALWFAIVAAAALLELRKPVAFSEHILGICWFLAVAIAVVRERWRGVGHDQSARLLIGAVFAQAFTWKAILRTEFLEGSFMRFSLLFCSAFEQISLALGLISPAAYAENAGIYASIEQMDGALSAPVLVSEPPRLAVAAMVITVWTLLCEGGVALTFLAPAGSLFRRWRNLVLLVFLWTVYSMLPVFGFGLVLATMGYAQTRSAEGVARAAYLATFFAILGWHYVASGPEIVQAVRSLL